MPCLSLASLDGSVAFPQYPQSIFFCCLLEGTKSVIQLDSLSASPFTTTERSDRTQHHSTKAAIHDKLDDKKYQVEQSAAIHFTDLGFNSTYQLPVSCRYLFFYLPFTRGKLADLPLPSNCDTNLLTVDCRLPPSISSLDYEAQLCGRSFAFHNATGLRLSGFLLDLLLFLDQKTQPSDQVATPSFCCISSIASCSAIEALQSLASFFICLPIPIDFARFFR